MVRLFLMLLALFGAVPAAAQPLAAGGNNIAASLIAESSQPAPGQTVTLAFSFQPRPGWHGYWLNPGDAGAPARVEWQLPTGVEAGALRYPVPTTLVISGLMNHVYEGPHALLTSIRVPPDAAPGTPLNLRARIDYLACTDQICVPERADLSLALQVGNGTVPADRRVQFGAWRAALPRPLSAEGTFALAGDRLRIAIPLTAAAQLGDIHLFAAEQGAIKHAAVQTASSNGDQLVLEVDAGPEAARLTQFEGLLAAGDGRGFSFTARPGVVPASGEPLAQPRAAAGASTFLLALLGAVLGGMLLNLMPCVFPILSLKALSLARGGADPRAARKEALAYSAGVILTCLALGALLLLLRSAGVAAGWAFQLQEPRFVLFLLLLVTAIALNLAGLFGLPGLVIAQQGGGTVSAFGTGALAAFIATPCTGPFMAAALGTALILPALGALAVFGGLGLGLALPFLLLGFIPGLRRLLPKPGPWMVRLQRILSVPMFLTALWLAWVLGRQTGVDGMALGLASVLALTLGLWWLGAGSPRRKWAAMAIIAAAVVAPVAAIVPADETGASALAARLDAQPFEEGRLAQLRAERRPVFLYFTADWCITCKVNEGGALASAQVAEAFRSANVQVLEGDWTLGDPDIGRFLERHGRSGVPLYLYYPPGREPQVLPQLLTASMLTALAA
jgi:thiol:disulfide interchange protein/DsbC/DsbD-like thiol-disulfide interchange protein